MASEGNADQIANWNGPAGDKWVSHQVELDRALAAFGTRVLEDARISPGAHVLDVGCGCGALTLLASSTTGSTGLVVGVDVSAQMIQRARERSSGRGNIQFVLADAAAEPFGGAFDVVLSRFGIMFFADPTAAFKNLARAMKPKGRLAFQCWRAITENPWFYTPHDVVAKIVQPPPAPPDPFAPGPFSLADRARVESVLHEAGFKSISIEPFDADVVMSESGLEAAVKFATTIGPAGTLLREATLEVVRKAREELEPVLAPHVAENGRVAMRGGTWAVTASV